MSGEEEEHESDSDHHNSRSLAFSDMSESNRSLASQRQIGRGSHRRSTSGSAIVKGSTSLSPTSAYTDERNGTTQESDEARTSLADSERARRVSPSPTRAYDPATDGFPPARRRGLSRTFMENPFVAADLRLRSDSSVSSTNSLSAQWSADMDSTLAASDGRYSSGGEGLAPVSRSRALSEPPPTDPQGTSPTKTKRGRSSRSRRKSKSYIKKYKSKHEKEVKESKRLQRQLRSRDEENQRLRDEIESLKEQLREAERANDEKCKLQRVVKQLKMENLKHLDAMERYKKDIDAGFEARALLESCRVEIATLRQVVKEFIVFGQSDGVEQQRPSLGGGAHEPQRHPVTDRNERGRASSPHIGLRPTSPVHGRERD